MEKLSSNQQVALIALGLVLLFIAVVMFRTPVTLTQTEEGARLTLGDPPQALDTREPDRLLLHVDDEDLA